MNEEKWKLFLKIARTLNRRGVSRAAGKIGVKKELFALSRGVPFRQYTLSTP